MVNNKTNDKSKKAESSPPKGKVDDLCQQLSALNFRKCALKVTKHPSCIPRKAFPPESELTVNDGELNVIPALESVLQTIQICSYRMQEKRALIHDMVKTQLMNGLCESCEIFNKLYREVACVGSFYEGLKITDANEFDLNIVLKLPFGSTTPYEVGQMKKAPGHMFIKWDRSYLDKLERSYEDKMKPIFRWVDKDGYLLTNKVHGYMERLLSKHLSEFSYLYCHDIKWRKSGPALTLTFDEVSVDLVPVFAFTSKDPPPSPIRNPQLYCPNQKNLRWFIVPKPLKGEGLERAWRLSFSEHERRLIHDFGRLKPAIKIVKRLRDFYKWKFPDSYSIKTIALWQIECGYLHHEDNLDIAFEKLLRGLMYFMEANNLPLFWDSKCNKFEEMKPADGLSKSNFLSKYLQSEEDLIELCNIIAEPDD